jgi:ADP-dependent NAD(P)H-hydrate dehydratase / NAD(P)H-hydrate epimerase
MTAQNDPSLWRHLLPWPDAQSHKHNRGRLAVFCGPRHRTGAARLAARAGARVGAGWTSLIVSLQASDIVAAHETSILVDVRRAEDTMEGLVARSSAVVFGPAYGLEAAALADLEALIRACPAKALVLDADALTLLSRQPKLMAGLGAAQAMLTPHAGEFARMFGPIVSDGVEQSGAVARETGAIIVLKGAATIIADGQREAVRNTHASPFLASAGTGDVLAGLIGGLCAQGMGRFDAACAACWIHGEASLRVGPGLIAEDLISKIPDVLNDLAPPHLRAH